MNGPQCGKGILEGARFCNYCGCPLPAAPAAQQPSRLPEGTPVAQPTAMSGVAVASLVLGLLSLSCCGITALPGLILGLVAISDINRSGGRLEGRGLAVAGIAVSAVMLAVCAVCVLWVIFVSLANAEAVHWHWMHMH